MTVLAPLLSASHARLRHDRRVVPLRDLRRQVAAMPVAPRFEAALRYAPRLALIAEVKRSSPSAGTFALDAGPTAVTDLAARYADAGAAALSILTEPTRFGGSDDDLRGATRGGLPVLRKDFTVDPYQVWQARALGAGAVLLLARALDDAQLAASLAAAAEAGIDALLEVHDAAELDRALALDATLIGVNARDLDTLETDRDRALELIASARGSGATLVAESGMATVEHLAAAAEAGAHAALVGTALLSAEDPAGRLAELASTPERGVESIPANPPRALVKTCGLRDEPGVRAAVAADADLAGFVVAANSRRRVEPAEAARLAAGLGTIPAVLVFRAPEAGEVAGARRAFGRSIPGIQLAGFDAPPAWLVEQAVEHPVVIGVVHRPASTRTALCAAEAWFAAGASHVMLEGAGAEAGGGIGAAAPVTVARRLNRIVPVGLSGGLGPTTVARVVRDVRPAFVDAASGLERNGVPDPRRIGAFVRAARREPTGADRVDTRGRFGPFGGRYVPETLIPPLDELTVAWTAARGDPVYRDELARLQRDFIGRPTPLFEVAPEALADDARTDVRVFLKREDLAHTGAHKINNALGQALLARRMGKTRIVAETGAGQHGVATAAACALLGMTCVVYMGTTDVERQAPNVRRMHLLGAEVRPVATGHGTLRDALNEALRDWVASVEDTAYILGSAAGPHPYPDMVAELQSVIGREARAQLFERIGRLPDVAVASVGGGSNAIGLFRPFLDARTRLVGVEAGGRGDGLGDNAASLGLGRPGVLHGAFTMLTQTPDGQVVEPHSVSAGLDYPGVGPQLSALAAVGRMEVERTSDTDAVAALHRLTRRSGILPALEPSHALAAVARLLPTLPAGAAVVVNLSGRGDKDLDIVERFESAT
jgi:tryptophan synthase beta chain